MMMTAAQLTERFVGKPYAFRDRSKGLDCYHLEREIYRAVYGIELPDEFNADPEQAHACRLLWQARQLRRGERAWLAVPRRPMCTALIRNSGVPVHLAHYLGNHQILEADESLGKVIVSDIRPLERAGRVVGYFLPPQLKNLV